MADKQHDQNEQVGGLAGLGAGVLAGASAGSAVMPIVGTFVGALVGGLLGNELGKTFGGAVLDAFDDPSPEVPHQSSYPPPQSTHTTQPGGDDVLSQLERLSQLKAQGMISDEEFKAAKARMLGL